LPSGGFSSDVRLPGWVAARGGSSPKKEKAAPNKKKAPQQAAPSPKADRPQRPANKQPDQPRQQKPTKEKTKKEVFLQPEGTGEKVQTSSRSRRRREPVWIPVNDQPIVTRPQSYFIEPPKAEPTAEKQTNKKKRRRRKPSQKSKPSGGTQ
jgi:hypothetical protein